MSGCAVVVQTVVPDWFVTVTVVPESAVPERNGVVLFVRVLLVGIVTTGSVGAELSTIKVVDDGVLILFQRSLMVT